MREEIPRFTLPGQDFKLESFVQLYVNREPFFRSDEEFHRDLLLNTLDEFDINPKFIFWGRSKPSLIGEGYEAVGMGRVIKYENVYSLYGDCLDYMIGPNEAHLEELIQYLPKGIKFKIGGKLYGR